MSTALHIIVWLLVCNCAIAATALLAGVPW